MEKRGRKREDKIRTIIALSPELIESIKDLSKQSGKNVSLFIEEVLALTGKPKYVLPRWDRHERKKICFRLSQSSIDYIKDVTNRDKVSKECLIDAKLREYESSPQRILDKTYPVAVEYITTGNVSKDDFFDAFKNLCVAYYTETAGDFQRRKDYRTIVGQKLAIRCIRSLTDSQLLSLDKVLQEFCEIEENYNNLQPSNRQKMETGCQECMVRQYPACDKGVPCCQCKEESCNGRQPCPKTIEEYYEDLKVLCE